MKSFVMDLGLLLLIGSALGGFSALTKDTLDPPDNTGARGNVGDSRDNNRSSRDGYSSSRTGDLNLGQLLRGDLSTNRDGDSTNDIVHSDIESLLDSLGVDPGSLTGSSSGYLDYHNNVGQPSFKSIWDALSGLISAYSGYDLTNAQRGEMAFNHDEAVLQRQYEMQMSNTAYQRAVSDMTSAGINPALMYGHGAAGASTPSGASASAAVGGVSSDLLSKLLDMVMNKRSLHMQDLMSKRQSETSIKIANIEAEKDVRIAELKDRREAEGQKLTKEQIEINRKKVEGELKLMAEQAETEESKRAFNEASARFASVQSDDIEILREYRLQDLRASAFEKVSQGELNAIRYMHEKGLLDEGVVRAEIRQIDQHASKEEQEAIWRQYKNCIILGHDPQEMMGANYDLTPFIRKELVILKLLTGRE